MIYRDVCIEAIGYALPSIAVPSTQMEEWLSPLYGRLGLCAGRIELMSGIRERRFWPEGTLPSQASTMAARHALQKAGLCAGDMECLINCSVSRDFVEPATSTVIHSNLKMGGNVVNFDISNACLGMASGIMTLANMIQLGQINAGIAVCGENSGPLVKNTIARLNDDLGITRKSLKNQFASLTIGSCAAAVILRSRKASASKHALLAAANYTDTSANNLCQGDANGGMTDNSAPVMETDSHALLKKGVAAAFQMWQNLKAASGWDETTPDVVCTHQVGKAHSALLYETLGIDQRRDFATYPMLGNCGSASWPVTCAMAEENNRLKPGDKLAILGIGSGINCTGLAVEW